MIRWIVTLLLLIVFSAGIVWFGEYQGGVVVEWLGYRVETSVAFTIVLMLFTIIFLSMLTQFLLFIFGAPSRYRKALVYRQKEKGFSALTDGFTAIAAGDIPLAKKSIRRSGNYLGALPIIRLLSAQLAQLEGDRELAKVHYTALLDHRETELIALKGLLFEARKENDIGRAIFLAERALDLKPDTTWAVTVLGELYTRTRRWEKAEAMIEQADKRKLLGEPEVKRALAMIALAKSREVSGHASEETTALIADAYRLLPNFPPVVAIYADAQLAEGNRKKAARAIEQCWHVFPHPDLAQAYFRIFARETLQKQLKMAERLFQKAPQHLESHAMLAERAMKAGELAKARQHLAFALGIRETVSLCTLMLELERLENSPQDAILHWQRHAATATFDPVWFCRDCGHHTQYWDIHCGVCNSFDSFVWNTPPSRMLSSTAAPGDPLLLAA